MAKKFIEGFDSTQATATEVTRIPRNCVIPAICDPITGVFNASPYTAGIVSVDPLILAIGVMGEGQQERIKSVGIFCAGLPSYDQVENIWAAANRIPDGISELDINNWHTFQTKGMEAPGIAECRVNLQCKVLQLMKLPKPWRTIMIVKVTGICVDQEILEMDRKASLNIMHVLEGGMNSIGTYGISKFSNEIMDPIISAKSYKGEVDAQGRVFVALDEFYKTGNEAVLACAMIPSATYIVVVNDDEGNPIAEVVSRGHLQASQPCLHVPFAKDSKVLARILLTKKFNICIPYYKNLDLVNMLNEVPGTNPFKVGFTSAGKSMFGIEILDECPITIDADLIMATEIEEGDTVFTVSAKVGAVLDSNLAELSDLTLNPPSVVFSAINEAYSNIIYNAYDFNMGKIRIHYDKDSVIAAECPSWGNHLTFGWLDFNSFNDWLCELVNLKILSKWELTKITNELIIWNDSKGIEYLKEYYPEGKMEEIRLRLTKLLRMMIWAHRDPWKWDQVHDYLEKFPNPYLYRSHHFSPMHMEKWEIEKYY